MKLQYTEDMDAIYLRFSDRRIVESEEVRPGIVLDFDEDGTVVAIEVSRSKLTSDQRTREPVLSDDAEQIEPQTDLVRSLLKARQRVADEGAPSITTWDDLDREIAERRGVPAYERAG